MPHPNAPYDYTKDDVCHADQDARAGTLPGSDFDDFVIETADVGHTMNADEIEKANGFEAIPPGDHELVILGFVGDKPKLVRKTAYVGSRRIDYSCYAVMVKMGLPDNPKANITDYFELPPATAAEAPGYYEGSKNLGNGAKGFFAGKLYQFLERVGFVIVKGKKLPDECLRLGNWRGRKVVATVIMGKPQFDATTGETKPGRPEIKLYSYRPAGSPISSPPASPAAPYPRANTAPAPATSSSLPGLDSI